MSYDANPQSGENQVPPATAEPAVPPVVDSVPSRSVTPEPVTPGSATPGSATPGSANPQPARPESAGAESAAPGSAAPGERSQPPPEPVPVTRAARTWVALAAGLVFLVVILVFILQNLKSVKAHFFWATWSIPLGVDLLFAAGLGALVMLTVGSLRILQLRRAARRAASPDEAGRAGAGAGGAGEGGGNRSRARRRSVTA